MRDQDRSAEPPAGALARTAVPAVLTHGPDASFVAVRTARLILRALGRPSEGHDPVGAARSGPQLKLCPQPQVRWALGLLIEKPAWVRPSA